MAHSDILRRAAELVAAGWSPERGPTDHLGDIVPVFGGTTGDTARAGVNKAITAHTLYSAIVTAAHEIQADQPMMSAWAVLNDEIMATCAPPGGTNFVHPVHAFNAAEGRTAEDVQALLHRAADRLDPDKPKDSAAKLPPVTL